MEFQNFSIFYSLLSISKFKVKTINRLRDKYVRKRPNDLNIIHKNQQVQKFQSDREYQRALIAVKMDSIFAKPLLSVLSGHLDGVYSIEKHPKNIGTIVSSSADGQVILWDISIKEPKFVIKAHERFVRSVSFSRPNGRFFYSSSDDGYAKQFLTKTGKEIQKFKEESSLVGIDCSWSNELIFATCGEVVSVFDSERTTPLHRYIFGDTESVVDVKWNPIEKHIIASSGGDRSIYLHDTRMQSPVHKVILRHRTNSIDWNPIEALNFIAGNEDNNVYTFDTRNLSKASCIHEDHLMPIMDVNFSPTGREFVSGSYDRTLRIFNHTASHSREVYHTQRMQKLFAVRFSLDNKYVISGSDDTNIRIWKSERSIPLLPLQSKELKKINYRKKLISKYKHLPEIRRIHKHRHLPSSLYGLKKQKQIQLDSIRRKEMNIRAHSKNLPLKIPKRKQFIVKEID